MNGIIGEKYQILRPAGAGGGGKVFLVYDPRMDRVLAAKCIGEDSAEERILKSSCSEYLVRMVDVVEEANKRWLIMEWIEGESLQQRLDRTGALAVEEALQLGVSLCRGLGQLHTMEPPVLYLDCKPSNIMLEKDGKIKIVDFGSAQVRGETGTVPLAASFGYAAPEQQWADKRKRRVDECSDIFSLGKTLYAALGGLCPDRPPYGTMPLHQVNSAVPAELCRIVEKCCDPLPERRYQTMAALERDLLEYRQIQQRRGLVWKAGFLAGLFFLGCSAWKLAEAVGLMTAGMGNAGERQGAELAGLFWKALQQYRFLVAEGMFWLILAWLWNRFWGKRDGRHKKHWEMTCSVLRTMKKQGTLWILILLLGLARTPLGGQAAEGKTGEAVILRDEQCRKLLVRDGAVLEVWDSIFLELDPRGFSPGKVYRIRVSCQEEGGTEKELEFFCRAKK